MERDALVTRPSRKAPAGEPEVHPLPHHDHARYYGCTSRNCTCEYRNHIAATSPPAGLRVIVTPWEALGDHLTATAGAIGDLRLTDAPLTLAAARLALGATLEAGR